MSKKVGILTWHYYSNFGSALQAYALQKSINKFNASAEFINYRNPKFGKVSSTKMNIHYLLGKVLGGRFYYPYLLFQKDYLKQTKLVQDKEQAKRLCQKFDTVVCGSDQIWAPNAFNSVYMADFEGNVNKISYAASIGLDNIPEEKAKEYKGLLSKFSFVSVREETGKKLLEEKCGIDSTVVLDPTLLLDVEEYKKLEKQPFNNKVPGFVFCYFLNKDHKYRKKVEQYAKENNLKIYGISACKKDKDWLEVPAHIGPREFLWLIANSSMIFTDSYHGTIFSLLYHKSFITFERFSSSDPICQNSRIYQLRDTYGLDDRIVACEDDFKIVDYDYDKFEEILTEKRKLSLGFLEGAI